VNRSYPDRPFIGVGAVIVEDGRVVLVRRRQAPLAGQWSLPGGAVELGETLEQAVTRETLEETGLHVRVGPVVDVLDRITRDAAGQVQYHYVLVDYLCWPKGGTLAAGSDVGEATWAHPADLARYGLTDVALSVIERALRTAATSSGAVIRQERG
jgi:8-oxo-dGTP diphosphatase